MAWFELDLTDREPLATRLERVSITHWDLKGRTQNALMRSKKDMTIGDVITMGPEIHSMRGLGTGMIEEINAKVTELLNNPHKVEELTSFHEASAFSLVDGGRNLPVASAYHLNVSS